MASEKTSSPPLHPTWVLGAFCEALVSGRRVAVLGDGSTGLAEVLAPVAGRRLYALDPDPQRTATNLARSPQRGASRISYLVLDDDLDAQAGAFDVVIVADLGDFDDPRELLRHTRELLGRRGVAVVAAANRGSAVAGGARNGDLDYYGLYDTLAAEFAHVRSFGQAPFVGFAVADFAAEGEPAVTIDSSLCRDAEEPRWFIMVASDRAVEIEPYTLVQVPLADGLRWLADEPAPPDRSADEAVLTAARDRVGELERQLRQLRVEREQQARLAEQRRVDATAASARAAELEASLEQERSRAARATTRVAELERAADRSRERMGELERAAEDHRLVERKLRAELAARVERETELEDALATIADREAELEAELAQRDAAPAAAAQPPPASDEPTAAATVRGLEFQVEELKKSLAAARNECSALQVRVEGVERLEQDLAAAERARHQAEERLAGLVAGSADDAAAEACARDVGRLEHGLRERGRRVAELEQRLQESARAGHELLREVVRTRARLTGDPGEERDVADRPESSPGVPSSDGGVREAEPAVEVAERIGDLESEAELLRQRCSACQADLEAAQWTIAGLRHELSTAADEATPEVRKLEEALRAARAEVAELRAHQRSREGRDAPPR